MKRSFDHTTFNNFEIKLTTYLLYKYWEILKKRIIDNGVITAYDCQVFINDFVITNDALFHSNKLK
jgi:hypothetical protein